MDTKIRVGSDIAERLLTFAVGVVKVTEQLPRRPTARHVALQLFRAATGGGANYEEARAAESREDFAHKVAVAAKEVRETIYWLELIRRAAWLHAEVDPLVREAGELAAILAASCRTARAGAK